MKVIKKMHLATAAKRLRGLLLEDNNDTPFCPTSKLLKGTSLVQLTVWSLVSYSSLRITQIKCEVHLITAHEGPQGE
jgi:hypothetical protein